MKVSMFVKKPLKSQKSCKATEKLAEKEKDKKQQNKKGEIKMKKIILQSIFFVGALILALPSLSAPHQYSQRIEAVDSRRY